MNRLHKIIVGLVSALLIVFVGSSCVQDAIVPAYVNEDAAEYAGEPTKLFMPYTTLFDAKRIAAKLEYVHAIENVKYGFYQNVTDLSVISGEQLKQTIFSPEGPIGLLAPMLLGGTFGALVIPRPGDKKKK
jgi:hypothetical protein